MAFISFKQRKIFPRSLQQPIGNVYKQTPHLYLQCVVASHPKRSSVHLFRQPTVSICSRKISNIKLSRFHYSICANYYDICSFFSLFQGCFSMDFYCNLWLSIIYGCAPTQIQFKFHGSFKTSPNHFARNSILNEIVLFSLHFKIQIYTKVPKLTLMLTLWSTNIYVFFFIVRRTWSVSSHQ